MQLSPQDASIDVEHAHKLRSITQKEDSSRLREAISWLRVFCNITSYYISKEAKIDVYKHTIRNVTRISIFETAHST